MRRIAKLVTMLGAIMAGSSAVAVAAEQIVVRGCARSTPPFCTLIGSGSGTYALISDAPIPTDVGIAVTGTKAGDLGVCFATPLKVVKWTRTGQPCPK